MEKQLHLLPGTLATEQFLLQRLAELQSESRAKPGLLALPIRILVPSSSLRMHLSERIVSELGSMLGVQIQTLQGLAINIVQGSGAEPRRANTLVEVLCRRAALAQEPISQALGGFAQGLASITGVVRDLFDAGFEKPSGEALFELIDEAPLSKRGRRRARSLLQVAMDVQDELGARQSGGRAALYSQASEALTTETDPLPTRALFVHGFADVTGRAGDLLQRLARRPNTSFLIDHPRDPGATSGAPSEADQSVLFTQRLLQPLEGILGQAQASGTQPASSKPQAFSAPGRQAELREVATRIRALLEQGARPERIGIVAREPASYAVALRRQLNMLGVPFSAPALNAPMDSATRRIMALVQLLDEGLRCPIDRWFDALGGLAQEGAPSASQLLMGLRVTGAGRLEDVLRIQPADYLDGNGNLPLPLRDGVQAAADQERENARFRSPARRLPGEHLHAWIGRARELAAHFEGCQNTAQVLQHNAHFEALRKLLDWRADELCAKRIAPVLQELEQGLGKESISPLEYATLLLPKLRQVALPPLGQTQAGAGVQVLNVMEARARSFDQLFLIGLNRDVFPRSIGADPIFPDEIRTKIEGLLPDIPILGRGRLEDRYLFAQLLSSSKSVTLSWQHSGEDGKPRMLSPLVERLFDPSELERVFKAPVRFPARPSQDLLQAERDAHEQAILGALHGSLSDFEVHLKMALEEQGQAHARALADLHRRVLGAFESTQERGLSMAPWLGFIGSQDELGTRPDPRVEAPFVTRIEGISRCPWQTVLTRFLRLEPTRDPLDGLPGINPMTLGNIVHHVLQRIDQRVLGEASMELKEAMARAPEQVDWPSDKEFEGILMEEARREAKLNFEPVPGLVRVLAECTRPYLQAAKELRAAELKQFMGGEYGVLGAEVNGRAKITGSDGEQLDVVFQADRVERQGTRTVLSDYKTGAFKSESALKGKGMPQGDQLQPMAYILAAREEADEVSGRYLYLGARPDKKQVVEVALDQDAEDQAEDFASSVNTVVNGWLAGTFFPRLTRADSGMVNPDCEHCDVKEACLQGDSAAREAMSSWAQPQRQHAEAAALSDLWQLRARKRLKKKALKGGKS